ncbi:MAG: alpha/beta hydrolase [Gemmatimonadetes bacterium]|nr:alpha/beta hydrolase [Gemmatimonadota bacterium]
MTKWQGLVLFAVAACDPLDPTVPGHLVRKTVVEDASLPAISLNGSRFHAEAIGSPNLPTIVFLHGGPGADYRSLLRMADPVDGARLSDRFQLVYWDQRGSGLSQRHGRAELTLAQYRRDLLAIIDHYAPNRQVLLVGHSWGGMFATTFINTYPSRVAGAVLIESGPLTAETFTRLEGDLFDLNPGREWLNDYAWSTQFFSADDHARMDFELMLGNGVSQPRHHQRLSPDPEPTWRLGALAGTALLDDGRDRHGRYTFDFTSQLNTYRTPVLFIAGARSEILGPSLQTQQLALYPSASLHVVDGAGHDVPWTHAAEVVRAMRPYLLARAGGIR